MFERFTAYARRAVVMAQEEARVMNHNYIGTEHILLALLRRPDDLPNQVDGDAAGILGEFGMTLEGVREEVLDKVGAGAGKRVSGHIPFTPRAKKVLELSLREALQLHHHWIGTEHVLLGLIREDKGVAVQIMREHGDLLAIRAAVLDRVPPGDEEDKDGLASTAGSLLRRVRLRRGGARADEEAEAANVQATPATDATLVEAARLDGAGVIRIFLFVMLPLALPAFVVVAIFQFTNIWNDFLFGVTILPNPNAQPVTVALNNLSGSFSVDWNVVMAGAVICALPTALIYILLGKFFVRGLLAGSVKG